jgi:hypothetical protein
MISGPTGGADECDWPLVFTVLIQNRNKSSVAFVFQNGICNSPRFVSANGNFRQYENRPQSHTKGREDFPSHPAFFRVILWVFPAGVNI